MKDEAKPLTAFVTHSGHYLWKVMPFGMKNAGSIFRKSMDNALLLHRNTAVHIWMMSLSIRQLGMDTSIISPSKKLTLSQMKWSTIEREAFSVLEALRKFDTWIFGSQIQVVSDHDPLTYLTNSAAPHSAELTRWALALQRYNVKVSYRKGSAHSNADVLSRLRISE
ncbi:transposon Ty3-I Gag-Pol polyprotein [Trichonephila clavipes]|nr:transposon Ty3-I Gag-Pol polyprotein [Trichonephila clavipes]